VEVADAARTGAHLPTKAQVNSVKFNGQGPKLAAPAYSVLPNK
jgi:hypothetical protein